jgi:hypothetical protein
VAPKFVALTPDHPSVELNSIAFVNEFALPRHDATAKQSAFNMGLVYDHIRALSNPDATLELGRISECFASDFTPHKLILVGRWQYMTPRPHPVFDELRHARPGETISPIDTAAVGKKDLLASLIPAVARFLELASPDNIASLATFLGSFEPEAIENTLFGWLFSVFNPRSFANSFLTRFLSSVAAYTVHVFASPTEFRFVNFLRSIDYLIAIAYVTVAHRAAKRGNSVQALAPGKFSIAVTDFSWALLSAIASISNYSFAKPINKEFVTFLGVIAPLTTPDTFFSIYVGYLETLRYHQTIVIPERPPDRDPTFALVLAAEAIRAFIVDPRYLLYAATRAPRIIALYGEFYAAAFASNDPALIRKYTVIFSELVRWCEFEENAILPGGFLPLLFSCQAALDSDILRSDPDLILHFSAFPLITFHFLNPSVFHHSNEDEQAALVSVLAGVLGLLLTGEDLPDPNAPLPIFETAAAELEFLVEAGRTARRTLNYAMVREATARILEFVAVVSSARLSLPKALAIAPLFPCLLSPHQDEASYKPILSALSLFLKAAGKRLTLAHNNAVEGLVEAAYGLTARRLQSAKAAGIAILVHVLFTDFWWTKATIVSSFYLSQQAIVACWVLPPYKEGCLRGLAKNLYMVVRRFAEDRFVTLAVDQAARIKALIDVCREKEPVAQRKKTAYVASMWPGCPLERLFWLSGNVREAITQQDRATAYEFQIRAAALVYAALVASEKESVPSMDFSALVDLKECAVDFGEFDHWRRPLLVDSDDISAVGLQQAIEGAAALAKQAGLDQEAALIEALG